MAKKIARCMIFYLKIRWVYKQLFLHPVHPDGFIQSMNGNTFATGYVFVGKERIGDLIRRKFFFR